jgi:hypothetical protein
MTHITGDRKGKSKFDRNLANEENKRFEAEEKRRAKPAKEIKPEIGPDIEQIVLYEGNFNGVAAFGKGLIIRIEEEIRAYKNDLTNTILFEGKCTDAKAYGNGVIIQQGKQFTFHNINGNKKVLDLESVLSDDDYSFRGYGNGLIINEGEFTAYNENGSESVLYDGYCEEWTGYGKGVIIESHGELIAYNEENKNILLYDKNYDCFGGYGNGAIVSVSEQGLLQITAHSEDNTSKLIYKGPIESWLSGYKDGIIMRDGNKFTAYRFKK